MSEGHRFPDPDSLNAYVAASPFADRPYRDLCSTCNHAEACGDHSTPENPIFFCEQFDAFAAVAPSDHAAPSPGLAATRAVGNRDEGLCMNCEDRDTCRTPRPQGGVWHCEEYR